MGMLVMVMLMERPPRLVEEEASTVILLEMEAVVGAIVEAMRLMGEASQRLADLLVVGVGILPSRLRMASSH